MESLKAEVVLRLQDIFDDVKMSSTLIESGKEVPAHRQLQGVRTKIINLIECLNKEISEENVAETTT